MKLIKRVSKGGYVQADTVGNGTWEIGKIVDFTKTHVTFESAVDGEKITIRRDEAFKATAAEYEAARGHQEAPEEVSEAEPKGLTDIADSDEGEATDEPGENPEDPDNEKSIVKSDYKKKYKKYKLPSGSTSQSCGDLVAAQLQGCTLEDVYDIVADELALQVDDLNAQYEHLNVGQQRMVLGNRLRAHYKRLANQTGDEE